MIETLEERALLSSGFHSIDGTGNNPFHSTWGSAGTDLIRIAPSAYADGASAPAGADRPSARDISNALSDQTDPNNTAQDLDVIELRRRVQILERRVQKIVGSIWNERNSYGSTSVSSAS